MTLRAVRGQPGAVGALEQALTSGRMHHAYRFEGSEGTGRELSALGLAQALLCPEAPGVGCGTCSSCTRVVATTTDEPHVPVHPDVVLVERGLYPKIETAKKVIGVDQIRQVVVARAMFPPHEGRARVFIVRAAEEMNDNAANALLKTLEEPRPQTYFVLITSRADRLLPTIRSRSLPVRFRPLPEALVVELLVERGVPKERAIEAAALADGSMTNALALADETAAAERRAFRDAVLAAARAGTAGAAVELGEGAESNRDALVRLVHGFAAEVAREARTAAREGLAIAEVLAHGHGLAMRAADALGDTNAAAIAVLSRLALDLGPAARAMPR